MVLIIILFIITIAIVLDLLVCKFYCEKSRKASKSRREKEQPKRMTKNKAGVQVQRSKTLYVHIRDSIYKFLDSLLRLNLAVTGYIPSHSVRKFLYVNVYCVDMDKTAVIYYGAEIRAPWNLHIGKGTIIGDRAILDARSGIYIGDNVNFSTGVWIWTLQHDVQASDFGTEGQGKPVKICNRAWLSCRTIVLPGVTVAEGAVAAAGAVLTKDCSPFSVWGGVSAKCIGARNQDLTYEFSGGHMLFL